MGSPTGPRPRRGMKYLLYGTSCSLNDVFIKEFANKLARTVVVSTPRHSNLILSNLIKADAETKAEKKRQEEILAEYDSKNQAKHEAYGMAKAATSPTNKLGSVPVGPVGNTFVPAAGIKMLRENLNLISQPGKKRFCCK